ncbi:hypothetical protein Tco_0868948 [Tanacetum coccineum]
MSPGNVSLSSFSARPIPGDISPGNLSPATSRSGFPGFVAGKMANVVVTWPLHAEQQINAFQMVVELGIAAEIRIDYRCDMRRGVNNMTMAAEEIEDGIRRLINDH